MKNTYKVNEEAVKKIAERVYDNGSTVINRSDLEELFPELKESEDEKIKSILVDFFKNYYENTSMYFEGVEVRAILAWLEKQGKSNMGISEATKQKLEDNLNKALEKETPESCNEFLEEQGEHKPADWSEEDELMQNNIIRLLVRISANTRTDSTSPNFSYPREIEWLKSLKERYTWKPSDEQMEVLQWCMPLWVEPKSKAVLESLIEDLKKLREE